jgi:hypothetical protein
VPPFKEYDLKQKKFLELKLRKKLNCSRGHIAGLKNVPKYEVSANENIRM